MKGKLIIARHQESEWNKLGKWTGTRDVHLTDLGFKESEDIGLLIQDLSIDCAFASMEVRSIETLSCILNICKKYTVPTEHSSALNERDYGDYTGKNKYDMEKMLGKEEFSKIHRGWDCPIPNGETLKMVSERAVPFFLSKILPTVEEGKNVLVVAHGNSLRTIIKYIENISDEGVSDLEVPFGSIAIYDLDSSGHMVSKEIRQIDTDNKKIKNSRAQIVATIGPVSSNREILKLMIDHGLDAARLNFSWGDLDLKKNTIALIKELAGESKRNIPIIVDLPGPRIQEFSGHTFNRAAMSAITEEDKGFIKFAVEQKVEYVAVSFVASAADIIECRKIIRDFSGVQKIIAKIERKEALDSLEGIIDQADAVMVARGDLGNEIPFEEVPFAQEKIVKIAKEKGKPVIVATQMLFSMVNNPIPTRAEVSDVETAILEGADAVMLSEETAKGNYPVDSVMTMEKIILEVEKRMSSESVFNSL